LPQGFKLTAGCTLIVSLGEGTLTTFRTLSLLAAAAGGLLLCSGPSDALTISSGGPASGGGLGSVSGVTIGAPTIADYEDWNGTNGGLNGGKVTFSAHYDFAGPIGVTFRGSPDSSNFTNWLFEVTVINGTNSAWHSLAMVPFVMNDGVHYLSSSIINSIRASEPWYNGTYILDQRGGERYSVGNVPEGYGPLEPGASVTLQFMLGFFGDEPESFLVQLIPDADLRINPLPDPILVPEPMTALLLGPLVAFALRRRICRGRIAL
jgi:hypothetical protein